MTLKNIIRLLIPYKRSIAFLLLTLSVSTFISFSLPLISKGIMDDGFIAQDYRLLIELVVLMLVVNIADILIKLYGDKKRINIQSSLEFDLKKQAFEHLLSLKMEYINDTNSVELSSNIETDITNISTIVDSNCIFVLSQVFNLIGGFIGLSLISPKLTLIVILFILVKYVIVIYFSKRINQTMNDYMVKIQNYSKWFGGVVSGIKEIKLFDMTHHMGDEFEKEVRSAIESGKKVQFNNQLNIYSSQLITYLLNTILYILGGYLVVKSSFSVGSVFAFITYGMYVMSPISSILNIKYYMASISPSFKRYQEFLNLKIENIKNSSNTQMVTGKQIEFQNLSFSYSPERVVLKNVNFKILEREKIAIVGANGAGKTTLIEVLLRLYEPCSGRIMMDGVPINDFDIQQYRNLFSVVSQDIYLFNDSIFNNICLYKRFPEEQIQQVIYDSGLEEFIKQNSIDYCVGENGSFLSGGQKQKIALARALLHDRRIIIFDEATSNIDSAFEIKFNELLRKRLQNKTVLMITHKMDCLKYADKVFRISNSEIKQLHK